VKTVLIKETDDGHELHSVSNEVDVLPMSISKESRVALNMLIRNTFQYAILTVTNVK